MPELYIGNVSKQIQQFAYRVPERPGVIMQPIPIGGQIRISPNGVTTDLSSPEIDAIVNQHRIYGMVGIEEMDSYRGRFGGLVYSIGKQISVDKLRRGMAKHENSLNEMGKQIRQEAALAVNSQIEQSLNGRPLHQLEMSFEEEEPRAGYSDDFDHLSEGVRVTREAQAGGRRRR